MIYRKFVNDLSTRLSHQMLNVKYKVWDERRKFQQAIAAEDGTGFRTPCWQGTDEGEGGKGFRRGCEQFCTGRGRTEGSDEKAVYGTAETMNNGWIFKQRILFLNNEFCEWDEYIFKCRKRRRIERIIFIKPPLSMTFVLIRCRTTASKRKNS